MLDRLIGEDVTLRHKVDDEPLLVRVDPGQVEQIVVNLAVNARDAMPRGGTLEISVDRVDLSASEGRRLGAPPGPKVRLTVTDTGVGMDAETLQHLFEPFFTTKGLGRGTGLGLATVYGIVEQAGAFVDVASAPERGTRFRVYFQKWTRSPPHRSSGRKTRRTRCRPGPYCSWKTRTASGIWCGDC